LYDLQINISVIYNILYKTKLRLGSLPCTCTLIVDLFLLGAFFSPPCYCSPLGARFVAVVTCHLRRLDRGSAASLNQAALLSSVVVATSNAGAAPVVVAPTSMPEPSGSLLRSDVACVAAAAPSILCSDQEGLARFETEPDNQLNLFCDRLMARLLGSRCGWARPGYYLVSSNQARPVKKRTTASVHFLCVTFFCRY
jgi:hypothetical protein